MKHDHDCYYLSPIYVFLFTLQIRATDIQISTHRYISLSSLFHTKNLSIFKSFYHYKIQRYVEQMIETHVSIDPKEILSILNFWSSM